MTSILEPTQHNQQNLEADSKLQEALALKLKGKEHLTSAQYREAVACFNKAIHLNPQDLETCLNKAIALGRIPGKLQASLACFDKVIQSKDPVLLSECFEGLVHVTNMIKINCQPETFLAFNDRLIQVKPDYIAAYKSKLQVLADYKRDVKEYIACFEKMLDGAGVNTPEGRSKAFYDVAIDCGTREEPIVDINIDRKTSLLFLDRAIQLYPNNERVYYHKTDCMLSLAQSQHNFSILEEALNFGEKMVQEDKEDIWLYEYGILLFCSRALGYGRFTDVIKQTDRLLLASDLDLETLQNSDSLYYYKGLALSALGNHQEAIACFDKAIAIEQKSEKSPYASGFKAELLVTLGQLEAAMKYIGLGDYVFQSDDQEYPFQHSRGVVFAAVGRTEEAIECFDKAAYMAYADYKHQVPKLYLMRKDFDILISLDQHEKAAECFVRIVEELESSEEYDKILEVCDQIIKAFPIGDGFKFKADLLVKLGHYEAALAEMEKAIQANPKKADHYILKGKLLHILGNSKAAIPLFEEAMQRSEEAVSYVNQKGILLYMVGQYEAAIKCFDESLKAKLTEDECNDTNDKGLALYALGQYQKTISFFDERKTKSDSSGDEIDLDQHFLHKSRALAGLGQFAEALNNFDEALVITETFHNEKFFVLFYKGEVLSRLGKETEALNVFDEAYEIAYGVCNFFEPSKFSSSNSRFIIQIESTKRKAFTYKEREALFRPLTQMQQAIVEVEDAILKLKQEKGETGAHTEFIKRFNNLKEEKNTLIGKCAKRIDDYSMNIRDNNDGLMKDMTCMKEQIDSLLKDICTLTSISKSKERKPEESKSGDESKQTEKSKDVGKKTTEKTSRCNMW